MALPKARDLLGPGYYKAGTIQPGLRLRHARTRVL